jgi:uncharacterized cupredoxin-like copper-binding protein
MTVRSRVALLLPAVALSAAVVSACAAAATPSPTASSPPGTVSVEVTLTDALRIEPATLNVPAGKAVVFVVRNSGRLDHEFFVGDEAAQAAHEQEMAGSAGMVHDEPNGIGVKAGQTKRLTMTFQTPAGLLGGCHIPGHYTAGMKATIQVQ